MIPVFPPVVINKSPERLATLFPKSLASARELALFIKRVPEKSSESDLHPTNVNAEIVKSKKKFFMSNYLSTKLN